MRKIVRKNTIIQITPLPKKLKSKIIPPCLRDRANSFQI
jgi:hypothetical protein